MKWRRAGWQILLHLFLAFLIVASIILPAFHIEIPNVRAQGTSTTELWVDGFDNSRAGWTRVGSSPYLDAQESGIEYKGLEGFDYRKNITISGGGSDVTDYQIKLVLHYGSGTDSGNHIYLNEHVQNDFDDIRFTTNTSLNLLDYYIEEKYDGDNCTVWVKVPSIPTSGTTICIYYGNSDATSLSNGTATFLFFDDFSGSSIDTDKWQYDTESFEVSNGIARCTSSTKEIRSITNNFGNVEVRVKWRFSSGGRGHICFRKSYDSSSGRVKDPGYDINFRKPNADENLRKWPGGGASATTLATASISYSSDTWYVGFIRGYGSNLEAKATSDATLLSASDTTFSSGEIGIGTDLLATEGTDYVEFDWIFVRNYVDPEPSVSSTTSEENNKFETSGSYVYSTTENDEIGDFTFGDLDCGTVQNVTLKIYCYCDLYPPFAGAEVYLWNGSSWAYIDDIPESSNAGSWSWESYDVSGILDSLEKVNNAKIYFKAIGSYLSSYPIKVDAAYLSVELAPEKFGKDTVGSNSYAWGGYNGKIFLTRFYCPQRASIIEGHVYMQAQNPSYIPAVKMVIYNSTFNDEPDRLVAESEPLIISDELKWWNFTFNSVEVSPGYYWIGLHINCSMLLDAVIVYYDDSEFELTYWKEDYFDDGPPDPFGTPDGKQSREYSIYVEYIPLAEPSPPDFTNKGKTISSQWWNATFYAKWNDTDGLQCWKFMWRVTIEPLFPAVAWTEYGWYNWTGNPTQAWSNITLDLPLNGSVVIEWRFMARDVLGHITETPVETFVTPANDIFVFALNSTAIQKWGLKYPITFKFNITNVNGQDIVVKKRYSENGDWITLPTKTSNDYFNGIECVRFNFTEGMAYVSVSFNGSSKLYIAFFNATTGDMLLEDTVKYAGKAKYYDDRKCAVTYTWDDWRDYFNATKLEQLKTRFVYVLNMCQTYQLYCSVGIVTNQTSPDAWSLLQTEINEGYVWAASHSRTHADLTNANYSTAIWEINGSKNDILGNLTLPYGEYVWLFIGPFGIVGQANDNVRQAISDSEYLIARSTASEKDYADWYSEGGYYTIGVYKILDDYKDDINTLKNFFDQGYENGYLMHFMGHPLQWNSTQLENLNDFLNYTHGKKDVWYAPVEYIYQYRYLCQFTTKWEIKLPPNATIIGSKWISDQKVTFYVYWEHQRPLSCAEFYWNASGAWELNGTIEWTEDVVEAWTNFTRTIPSDVERVGWYVTCKDIFGVWGNTSLQILEFYTSLNVGWNNFTAWSVDVGKTLEEICANIQGEAGVDARIVIKYNGTEYRYDYGYSANATVKILSTNDELRIYCLSSGKWYHNYGRFAWYKVKFESVDVEDCKEKRIEIAVKESFNLFISKFERVSLALTEILDFAHSAFKNVFKFPFETLAFKDCSSKAFVKVSFQSLGFSEKLLKHMRMLRAETLKLPDKFGFNLYLFIREHIIDKLHIQDVTVRNVRIVKADRLALPESIVKHVEILRIGSLSFMDKIAKAIRVFQLESLAFSDKTSFNIYLLLREQIIDKLGIQDLLLKSIKILRIESLGLQDLMNKIICKLQAEQTSFLDEQFISVFIVIKEQVIHEFVSIGDRIFKFLVIIKAEPLTLPETATKNIRIFKSNSLSLLDQTFKRIGPFFHEKVVSEVAGFKDLAIIQVWTPWYNNPAEFMKVILFGFCIGLFIYWIAKRL